jgi:hypothetical protein
MAPEFYSLGVQTARIKQWRDAIARVRATYSKYSGAAPLAAVQTVETSDSIEVQRCRRAQYTGHPKALTLSGSKISGFVQSVKEERSWGAPRWIVTIIVKREARSRSSAI